MVGKNAVLAPRLLEVLVTNTYHTLLLILDYVPDKWEVEPHKVEVHDELGQGAFGQVFKGILYTEDENGEDIALEVAIKVYRF